VAGRPSRQFSTTILAGSWPQTDPASCDALAQAQHNKAVDLLGNADDVRGAANQLIAEQSGATIEAFHQSSHELASTMTGHADTYFAMSRASTESGRIMSALQEDLDRIDYRAHQQIDQLMKSATTGPAAAAARARAIQVIAQARAQTVAASTAAAEAITAEGSQFSTQPEKKPDKNGAAQAVDYQFKRGGPGDTPKPNPVTNPPTTTPVPAPNPNHDDLDDTIPNHPDLNIGGDGAANAKDKTPDHHPFLNGKLNPLDAGPDRRPIPTGTAEGANGSQYGFYSKPSYHDPAGSKIPNDSYVTSPSQIVDLHDPSKVIGQAPVAQASGAYDPASKSMYVVGNAPDGTRHLWKSTAVDPANPNAWAAPGAHWDNLGEVMLGTRENQLVQLGGGGYMLTGATDDGPITGTTASTPEGLVGQVRGTPLVANDSQTGVAGPYGPTIVTDHYDPVTGTDTIQMRVSQFGDPALIPPAGSNEKWPYDPRLYTTTFTVTQP
jgi:hypothetical protein